MDYFSSTFFLDENWGEKRSCKLISFNEPTCLTCALTHFSYFFNLTPEEFDPAFFFSVPPLCVSFCAFNLCPFVFFSPFCCCTVVCDPCSPPCFAPLACFCPLLGAFPFFFIKKRGVVQMVLRLGGFFSSLRFTLLNIKQNKYRSTFKTILPKTWM